MLAGREHHLLLFNKTEQPGHTELTGTEHTGRYRLLWIGENTTGGLYDI